MRRRFFWGMVSVGVLTLLLGGLTAAFLIAKSVERSNRDEFLDQALRTGQLIEGELQQAAPTRIGALQLRRALGILDVARRVGGHDYLEAAFIDREEGFTLLSESPRLLPALAERALLGGQAEYRVDVDGQSVLALVQRIETPRGELMVVIGSTADLVPWDEVARRLVLALGAGVALAAVLSVALSRSIGRRLDGLADASKSIADGDLSARAPDEGTDEVAVVATAFNDMADRLEDAQRRERDFLMSVSHDLRTPLTTIRGYAEGLADDAIPSEDLARVGGVLHTQADRLSRLIDDLMQLSRLEARQFTLRPELVDLAAHLKEETESVRERADEARVRLVLDVEDVGSVIVDPDRFAQVAGNLLENALRYTPEGGTVKVRLRGDGQSVRFSVTDTGPGIDPDDLPFVFERLYVAQRYRPVRPEGSGLGLNIVKELVEAMGGRVSVDSALGEGTRVTVELPVPPTGPVDRPPS